MKFLEMNARGDREIDFNIERKIRSWADGQKNQRERKEEREREKENKIERRRHG